MSIANLLSASSDISQIFATRVKALEKEITLKPDLGVFSAVFVEISKLGIDKQ
ncbi:hypothetical protein [Colwellia hornerae]|uniref:hypothetical protein n=1 Tax=Colwellia hornerae TaxID=89402 RepID=UPI001478CF3C|nr:hypothetical protein [Colwellia hornerae]